MLIIQPLFFDKTADKDCDRKKGAIRFANTVLFLANSPYITGQIISVDGGRTLNQ
jgi:pteridine reductase